MSGPRVVLDASAMLAWVLDERGADVVGKILPVSAISVVNLTEVLYRAVEHRWSQGLERLENSLRATGVTVVEVVDEDARVAAEVIGRSRASIARSGGSTLSLADGVCIAVAARLGLPVTGGDQHWETLDLPVEYVPFR